MDVIKSIINCNSDFEELTVASVDSRNAQENNQEIGQQFKVLNFNYVLIMLRYLSDVKPKDCFISFLNRGNIVLPKYLHVGLKLFIYLI